MRRRKRGSDIASANISTALTAPAPPAIATTGIRKQLIAEIIGSDEGISRAELSRHLGASSSKVGTMVKDLLNTDLGFYEVKDGTRKLIKFRKGKLD